MKVTLKGEARFYFDVRYGLVKLLMHASKLHYDGECQRASAVRGAPIRPGSNVLQQENGVLTVWKQCFARDALNDDFREVTVTWRELDLVAKICENAGAFNHEPDQFEVANFRDKLRRMFEEAGPKVIREWVHEFTV